MRTQGEDGVAPKIDSLCSAPLGGPEIRAQPLFQALGKQGLLCWMYRITKKKTFGRRSWRNFGGDWGLQQSPCSSFRACMAGATPLCPSEIILTVMALLAPRPEVPSGHSTRSRAPLLGISLRHKTFYFRCQQIIFQCLLQQFMSDFKRSHKCLLNGSPSLFLQYFLYTSILASLVIYPSTSFASLTTLGLNEGRSSSYLT